MAAGCPINIAAVVLSSGGQLCNRDADESHISFPVFELRSCVLQSSFTPSLHGRQAVHEGSKGLPVFNRALGISRDLCR